MIASFKKRGQAVALTAVASLIAVAGVAANPAVAAEPSVGNINAQATDGEIIIHKLEAPEWSTEKPTGEALTIPNSHTNKKIEGVTFKVFKVDGIDLTKSTDWEKLKGLKYTDGAFACDPQAQNAKCSTEGLTKGAQQGQDLLTNSDGEAKATGLPVGLYLVEETAAPNKVTKMASPFLVTIPFPNATAADAVNGWLYKVNVYPKNDVSNLTKTVGDATATVDKNGKIGTDIEWVIGATVPEGKDLTGFRVKDVLDPKVKFNADLDPKVTVDGTSLEKDTHYTITDPGTAEGGTVVFTFTKAGVAELNKKKGKKVEVTFYTTVVKELADNKVENKNATVGFANNPGDDPDYNDIPVTPPPPPGTPDPEPVPTAFFGDFKLKKVSNDGTTTLKGATFELYPTCQDATAGTKKIGTVVSDDNGIVALNDLYRGKTDDATKTYCLKETVAPAGFKLNETPKEITITKTSGTEANGDDTFENTPYKPGDVPDLPLTGAAGKLLLTVGGAAILFFAVGTLFVTRRKNA